MFTPLTFILAGNYEEFAHYCQSRDLNRHDFVYLNKTADRFDEKNSSSGGDSSGSSFFFGTLNQNCEAILSVRNVKIERCRLLCW